MHLYDHSYLNDSQTPVSRQPQSKTAPPVSGTSQTIRHSSQPSKSQPSPLLSETGVQWNPAYTAVSSDSLQHDKIKAIQDSLVKGNIKDFVSLIMKCPLLVNQVKKEILTEIDQQCTLLTCRTDSFASVLLKSRSINILTNCAGSLFTELVTEMAERYTS